MICGLGTDHDKLLSILGINALKDAEYGLTHKLRAPSHRDLFGHKHIVKRGLGPPAHRVDPRSSWISETMAKAGWKVDLIGLYDRYLLDTVGVTVVRPQSP